MNFRLFPRFELHHPSVSVSSEIEFVNVISKIRRTFSSVAVITMQFYSVNRIPSCMALHFGNHVLKDVRTHTATKQHPISINISVVFPPCRIAQGATIFIVCFQSSTLFQFLLLGNHKMHWLRSSTPPECPLCSPWMHISQLCPERYKNARCLPHTLLSGSP